MTGVELSQRVPCATCGGTNVVRIAQDGTPYAVDHYYRQFIGTVQCPNCTDGTVRVAVSCASCRYWNQGYYCSKTDTFNCEPDHGCKLWTAKEGTDGNGND